jgi:hypothetical protein
MKTNLLKTYKYIFLRQGMLTKFLGAALFVLACTYGGLLVTTIGNISERKEIRSEIKHTQARISELETKYFQLAANIDSNYVASLGFGENKEPVFAYTYEARSDGDALAMNTTSATSGTKIVKQ